MIFGLTVQKAFIFILFYFVFFHVFFFFKVLGGFVSSFKFSLSFFFGLVVFRFQTGVPWSKATWPLSLHLGGSWRLPAKRVGHGRGCCFFFFFVKKNN